MQPKPTLRMTKQRRVILDELKKLKTHPTAGELCKIVRKRLPHISLGTVYRNLEILSRRGVIQKLDVGGVEMRFDGNIDNHYHLRCVECGKVFDVDMSPMPDLEQRLESWTGFRVLGHNLEFVGLCPQCNRSEAAL
ncbi:MAG: transcriptional repressor [Desulfarculaceae bacterium]|jgi:Fur family ferric uptake transcriptional regulator